MRRSSGCKNDLADALDMKVGKWPTALSWQADRIEKQSAALELAKAVLKAVDRTMYGGKYADLNDALAAIDALKGE